MKPESYRAKLAALARMRKEAVANRFLKPKPDPARQKPKKGTTSRLAAYREELLRTDGLCYLCGVDLRGAPIRATLDHIIPKSRGGTNQRKNLALCCLKCNAAKADKIPGEKK